MKKVATIVVLLLCTTLLNVSAQSAGSDADPVIMTINKQPVLRSEFEYSFNKNNSEGVIDKKSVEEYVDLFINYKLKVAEAYSRRLDTLTSFKQEYAQYRDQQVLPMLVTTDDIEAEARRIYQQTKDRIGPEGLIQTAHILMRLEQQATPEQQAVAKARIDSVYTALKQGADFAELAKKVSQDPGSAAQGGLLPFVQRGQLVKEYEDAAFTLKDGELSGIVQSPFGYHVILMKGRKQLEPFEEHHASIINFIEQRGLRDYIANQKVDSLAAAEGVSRDEILVSKTKELSEKDPELENLIREYYEGLLLYEVSNREVWERAAKDEAGLAAYFAKNKKKYVWTEPRFKGIAYHVKDKADVKAVKNSVKKVPFDRWPEVLRTTFNADSVLRIRVEKGIFKRGDNALVDREVFKRDTVVTALQDYPIDAVYGKVLKKGPEEYTDVRGLVVADYQDELERQWVEDLRRKFSFTVDNDVLKTVNAHKPSTQK